MHSHRSPFTLASAFRRHPVLTFTYVCIHTGVELVHTVKSIWQGGRRLLSALGFGRKDDAAWKDRHLATIQAHQQRLRPSTYRWTLWAALCNPIAFLGWAPKPKRKRQDARTVASALPEWYEHHTPAALQALPPRPSAGSDKKRVAFAEAKTRTFDPKAPPCMVAALEETVVCIHQDGAAKAMDRFISSTEWAVGSAGRALRCVMSAPAMRSMDAPPCKLVSVASVAAF